MKKTTLKAIAGISAAGAIAIGLGAVSSWYTNWDTSTWFGRGGSNNIVQPENPDPPISDNSSIGGAIVTAGESNGIALMSAKLPRAAYAANGISAQADTAYVLTATVTPSDATDMSVSYIAEWADHESEWANGKTLSDYVTVKQGSDGFTATVECKQAFGEQVIIRCVSDDNPSASATCRVDYCIKILGNKFKGIWIAIHGNDSCSFDSANASAGSSVIADLYIGSMMAFSAVPTKSIGTLADTYSCTITFTPTSDIMSLLPNATAKTLTLNVGGSSTMLDNTFVDGLFGSGVYGTSAFYQACLGTKNSPAIKCVVYYADEHSERSFTYYLGIDPNSVKVPVNDVELDTPSIIF